MGSTPSFNHHTACLKHLFISQGMYEFLKELGEKAQSTCCGLEGMSQLLLRDELGKKGKRHFLFPWTTF
jgi:hypothetical protein